MDFLFQWLCPVSELPRHEKSSAFILLALSQRVLAKTQEALHYVTKGSDAK